jgi:hypothetical protein
MLFPLLLLGGAQGQGTVYFWNNSVAGDINYPVFESDGSTLAAAGSAYAQLYAGPEISSLAPVGSGVLLGPNAGRFNGGVVSIPTVPPGGVAWVQVQAWDAQAAGFDDAVGRGLRRGRSNVVAVRPGGATDPPSVPAYLTGLVPFRLEIPEPTVLQLATLGCVALLGCRPRRRRGRGGTPRALDRDNDS